MTERNSESVARKPCKSRYLDGGIIYSCGLPKGSTDAIDEVLLLTNATPELIEKVKVIASRDGFHSFRVGVIDLKVAPDFTKCIARN